MFIKYYLIHNLDINRESNMKNLFTEFGINNDDVTWINHPNKNEISDSLRNYEIKYQ